MRRFVHFIASAVMTVTAAMAQIQDPDRVVSVCPGNSCGTEELSGTWQFTTQLGVLVFVTFDRDGGVIASAGHLAPSAARSADHGVWTHVGYRKFLVTVFHFDFGTSDGVTNIIKLRLATQLSPDGETLSGSLEAVLLSPDGSVITTIPGGTYSVRDSTPRNPLTSPIS